MKRSRRHAFTMIEVLIAGTVLVAGAAALLSAWAATTRIVGHQRHLVESIAVTRMYAERLLLLSDAQLMSAPSRQVTASGDPSGTGLYTVTWICADDSPFAGATTCDVKTSWEESTLTKSYSIKVARDTR
jgi:type II secretory pathway pseudopilin PulG